MKHVIKIMPVVRVCNEASAIMRALTWRECPTLNRRGGTTGDREVMISLIEPRIKSVHPTDRRAMVSADDPYNELSEHERLGRWSDIQLVSPLFRPIRAQTVPANNRPNPTKSNSFMCS